MAAPPEKTLKDLSGKWVMNKTLSDDPDKILQLQGVSWFLRRAISLATVTLTITEYTTPPNSTTHIDIHQRATGGISSTHENRTLDWTERDHSDGIFGDLRGRSRWVGLGELQCEHEVDRAFLVGGWEAGMGGTAVQSWVVNEGRGWSANQVWGFEEVGGERRYVRHVVVRKLDDSDWKQGRLVYDYLGPADATAKKDDEEEDDDAALAYGE